MSIWLFNRRVCGFATLILMVTLFSGCAVKKSPYEYFYEGRFIEAKKAYKYLIPKDATNKDYVYHRLHYASCAMEGGDYYFSDQCLTESRKQMEVITGKGEAAAVIGSEYSKEYKGDPYEKAMAHAYCGFACLRSGNPERALMSFRKALVADQDTRTKKTDETKDFVTGHYFAGLCYHLLGESENANVQFELASKYSSQSEFYTQEKAEKSNCFLIIGSGSGPFKTAYGPGNSMVKVVKPVDEVAEITFECDGVEMGKAVLMDDLFVEANAQGWGEMDSARLAKGIAKEIVANLPYVGALHNLIRSEVDLRVWSFLPGNIYLWSGSIEPGLHTFTLRCRGRNGRELPQHNQVWFNIPVSAQETTFMNFRILPYRQDIKDKVVVSCSNLKSAMK